MKPWPVVSACLFVSACALSHGREGEPGPVDPPDDGPLGCGEQMLDLAAGVVTQGCNPERRSTCLGESVTAFAIGVRPVSRADYLECAAAGECELDGTQYVARNGTVYPASPGSSVEARVTVAQAEQYCAFCGMRLPTEAEWERAAWETGATGRAMGLVATEWLEGWYTTTEDGFPEASRLVIHRGELGLTYRYGSDPLMTGTNSFRCASSD